MSKKKEVKKADSEQPKRGRPTSYDPEIALAICEFISESKTLNEACEALGGIINRRTVLRWLADNEDFRHQYARAHELQGDYDADTIRDIVRRVIDPTTPEHLKLSANDARVAIDALKWAAGKRNPKKYGDKTSVDLNVNRDPATLTDAELESIAAASRDGTATTPPGSTLTH